MIKSVFTTLAIGFAISAVAQPININIKQGQKFSVEQATKIKNSAEVMGQTMENKIDMTTVTLFEIKEVTPEGITLTSMVTKAKADAEMMGQEMKYNSESSKNSGPFAESFAGMLNKTRNIWLDSKGKVIKQDERETDEAMNMMTGGLGNTNQVELFIPALIGKELKIGGSLPDENNFTKDKFSSSGRGIYTVTSLQNDVASVSYTGTSEVKTMIEQMGMEMQSKTNNTIKSEMQVDIKTGHVLATTTVTDTILAVETSGMTIPGTGKTEVIVVIKPVK